MAMFQKAQQRADIRTERQKVALAQAGETVPYSLPESTAYTAATMLSTSPQEEDIRVCRLSGRLVRKVALLAGALFSSLPNLRPADVYTRLNTHFNKTGLSALHILKLLTISYSRVST